MTHQACGKLGVQQLWESGCPLTFLAVLSEKCHIDR